MIFKAIFLYIFLMATMIPAQQITYTRDTTYTLKIAFNKYKKDYPFIKDVRYDKSHGLMRASISYDSSSGRPLMLDIFSDDTDSGPGKAAVIMIHGGGWSSGDRNLMYPLADYLAHKGYVAVAIEYRLSPEARYPAGVNDIKKAISWVLKNSPAYLIDKDKVAVLGCSAGAQLAGLVGLTYAKQYESPAQKFIHAIINIDGIMDFTAPQAREHEDDPKREITPAGRWFGGRYAQKTELWREASPIYYVNENAPPMLFINSSQPRFHVGRDEAIKILDKYSIYSEVHTFDDAPHSFWLFEPWFERTGQYIDHFLQHVLIE